MSQDKTKVRIKYDIHQEQAKAGDIGYIDGYINGADGRPYACVVIRDFISLVPHYALEIRIFKEEL
jgi:hypothetical protein